MILEHITEERTDEIWFDAPFPALLMGIELSSPAVVKRLDFGERRVQMFRPVRARTLTPSSPRLLVPKKRLRIHFDGGFAGTVRLVCAAPQRGILGAP